MVEKHRAEQRLTLDSTLDLNGMADDAIELSRLALQLSFDLGYSLFVRDPMKCAATIDTIIKIRPRASLFYSLCKSRSFLEHRDGAKNVGGMKYIPVYFF